MGKLREKNRENQGPSKGWDPCYLCTNKTEPAIIKSIILGWHVSSKSQVLFWSRFSAIQSLDLGWQTKRHISAPGTFEDWDCQAKSLEMIGDQRYRPSDLGWSYWYIFLKSLQSLEVGGKGERRGRRKALEAKSVLIWNPVLSMPRFLETSLRTPFMLCRWLGPFYNIHQLWISQCFPI